MTEHNIKKPSDAIIEIIENSISPFSPSTEKLEQPSPITRQIEPQKTEYVKRGEATIEDLYPELRLEYVNAITEF
jgi:hypothetical protein